MTDSVMATANGPPSFRCDSPPPDALPTPAIGALPPLSRCLSSTSSRNSLGSSVALSRQSSASFASSTSTRRSDISATSRHSSYSLDGRSHRRRRGYMRPQVTDFAASAKSRESVMSLGSIAHLQYYFARTGLLDGKGGQLARKKNQQQRATLDLSVLDTSGLTLSPTLIASDHDSTYASMGGSPDFGAGSMVESPVDDDINDFYDDAFEDSDPGMLPPTVSTYHHREKPVPKPPSIVELKADLEQSLGDAAKALSEVKERKAGTFHAPPNAPKFPNMPQENTQGWFELQGMNMLDVVTLAIRAAKMYYTAHELPDRLDAIKSEKQIRADLLGVMEVLKQMATRNFKDGMREDEVKTIDTWVESVLDILEREEEIEHAEREERAGWTWLSGDWTGRELERERQFLMSMDPSAEPLPEWTLADAAATVPTPFLAALRTGLRLVKLHNSAVKKSRRRFGAIGSFHTDTQKPYRCADNLRYWAKAAELRFEVMLSIDALGIVYDSAPRVWVDFDAAILAWCRRVREEITRELAK